MSSAHASRASGQVTVAVLVSAAFLSLQVVLVHTGQPGGGHEGWWLVGVLLLWFVLRRRSRFARGFVVVTSLAGAAVWVSGADQGPHHVLVAVSFLGQALPLLTPTVRRHVQQAPAEVEREPARVG